MINPVSKNGIWLIEMLVRSDKWSSWAPKTAGKLKIKEKLKAGIGFKPMKIAEEIVLPEREIPGIIAKAWKQPIIKASKSLGLSFLAWGRKNLIEKSNKLVTKRAKEISLRELKRYSIWELSNKPKIAVGIEAMRMKIIYFLVNLIKADQNAKITTKAVAKWTKMSNKTVGWVSLKKCWIITRWPELETGKNSVKPWTRPKIKAWKKVIIFSF